MGSWTVLAERTQPEDDLRKLEDGDQSRWASDPAVISKGIEMPVLD